MARRLRIQYPGAIYHVMNRGDRREAIFMDDQDRAVFLTALEQACGKTDWQVHAFCLMSNHFHLVLETPGANLWQGMKWFLSVYTRRFNVRHNEFGHLFSGRYKALIVDGSGNGYLKAVGDYVHLNPVRAGIVSPEAPLEGYPWSSYPLYIGQPARRPKWLRVDRLMGEWHIEWDSGEAGARFAQCVEARRRSEAKEQYEPLPEAWCVGSDSFQKQMLSYVEEQRGKWNYGPELQQAAEAKAERLLAEALASRGLPEGQLAAWPKTHPVKLALAARLRNETTVTVEWIAQRLAMGTPRLCRPPLDATRARSVARQTGPTALAPMNQNYESIIIDRPQFFRPQFFPPV
jgi:REP element-mobilizing transposase RayT